MRESIKEILIRRDGMSESSALALIAEAQDAFEDYLYREDDESAYNICQEYFNLEPDYLEELTLGTL